MKDEKIIKNKKDFPNYTKGEEIFNAVTHIVGGAFSIIATILLLVFSIKNGDGVAIISSIIYGFSMIILFTMSSIYHFLRKNKAKKLFRIFDHCSIFLFIAGSYTPICLISLKDSAWGITLLCLIWSFAIIGITLNAISIHNKFIKVFSQICYLVMGWCAIIAIVPLLNVFT
ncbi:MAG: hemolysin III family protein [Clostridia bacterium]|nr:hemolysin III family protein [Clostridia bacterium]